MKTVVQYIENGAVSTTWSRIMSSKVTYAVMLYVLSKGLPLFESQDWLSAAAWKQFLPTVFAGSIIILGRSAVKKVELASNAVNPDIENVGAMEVAKRSGPSAGVTAMLVGMAAMIGLSGCTKDGAKGKVSSTVSGQMCYTDPETGVTACIGSPAMPPPPPPLPPTTIEK